MAFVPSPRPAGLGIDEPERAPIGYSTICRSSVAMWENVEQELSMASRFKYTFTPDVITPTRFAHPRARTFQEEFVQFVDYWGLQGHEYGTPCQCDEEDGLKCNDNHCINSASRFMCPGDCGSQNGKTICRNSPLTTGRVHTWMGNTEVKEHPKRSNDFGLFAKVRIMTGDCVGVYGGELKYRNNRIFRKYGLALGLDKGTLEVDSMKYGNITRFINHDFDDNVRLCVLAFGEGGLIGGFFATNNIEVGMEILFNYGYGYDCSTLEEAVNKGAQFYRAAWISKFCGKQNGKLCPCQRPTTADAGAAPERTSKRKVIKRRRDETECDYKINNKRHLAEYTGPRTRSRGAEPPIQPEEDQDQMPGPSRRPDIYAPPSLFQFQTPLSRPSPPRRPVTRSVTARQRNEVSKK